MQDKILYGILGIVAMYTGLFFSPLSISSFYDFIIWILCIIVCVLGINMVLYPWGVDYGNWNIKNI